MSSKPQPYAVLFRGHWACPCQVIWIPAYEAELQRRGLLDGPIHIYQLIGGNPSSGGTHLGGGESDFLDLPGDHDEAVWVARQMGADATWHRLAGWDGPGSIEHDHSGLTGCPHNVRYAGYQLTDVRNGLDGLADHGPDTGPRPLSGRTWPEGIAWAQQQEDDMQDADWQKFQAMLDTQRKGIVADLLGAVVDAGKLTVLDVLGRVGKFLDRNGKPRT